MPSRYYIFGAYALNPTTTKNKKNKGVYEYDSL